MIKARCPQCRNPITLAEGNEPERTVVCQRCGYVLMTANSSPGLSNPPLPLPRGVMIQRYGDILVIVRCWFRAIFFLPLLVSLFFLTVAFVRVPAIYSTLDGPALFTVFAVLLLLLFMFYHCLCQLVNRTEICMNSNEIRMRHYPLPYPFHKRIELKNIRQLYCTWKFDDTPGSYPIMMVRQSGYHECLISVGNREHALFITQELQQQLRIVDQPLASNIQT